MDNDNTRVVTDAATGETKTLKVYNGGVSEHQIEAWKKEYRKVSAIEIVDGDELYIGYFHRPTMDTISAANKFAKTDEIKAAGVLLDNCWLGGDPTIKTDGVLRMAATAELSGMLAEPTAELKNL